MQIFTIVSRLILLVLIVLSLACGVKGPPLPPLDALPQSGESPIPKESNTGLTNSDGSPKKSNPNSKDLPIEDEDEDNSPKETSKKSTKKPGPKPTGD